MWVVSHHQLTLVSVLADDLNNDIALVKLKERIDFEELSSRVSKIDVASKQDSIISSSCSVYGWGCDSLGMP